jgi:hypothetical protein
VVVDVGPAAGDGACVPVPSDACESSSVVSGWECSQASSSEASSEPSSPLVAVHGAIEVVDDVDAVVEVDDVVVDSSGSSDGSFASSWSSEEVIEFGTAPLARTVVVVPASSSVCVEVVELVEPVSLTRLMWPGAGGLVVNEMPPAARATPPVPTTSPTENKTAAPRFVSMAATVSGLGPRRGQPFDKPE